MNEPAKRAIAGVKTSDESQTAVMDTKLLEIVNVLKSIDEKLASILKTIREINSRG